MIIVANKKRSIEKIQKDYPNAVILDVTSTSPSKSAKLLSPFYPHGGIPIPGESRGMTATCVEGIWQGLKVFENCGIDQDCFYNTSMKGIKRTVRKYGRPLGHQFGVYSSQLLSYSEAKNLIYLPCYKHVLENVPNVKYVIERIKEKSKYTDIVLLDYNVNPDNADPSKPLSHAELIKMYIEGRYPEKLPEMMPEKGISSSREKTGRKKVGLDINSCESINELLSKEAYCIKDIISILHLNYCETTVKKYVASMEGIKSHKQGRKTLYSMVSLPDPTLL